MKFSSIFHQSLKPPVYIGIPRGGRDLFLFHPSSTFFLGYSTLVALVSY